MVKICEIMQNMRNYAKYAKLCKKIRFKNLRPNKKIDRYLSYLIRYYSFASEKILPGNQALKSA